MGTSPVIYGKEDTLQQMDLLDMEKNDGFERY